MTEDPRSAKTLLDAKRQLNAIERATGRRHLGRLEAGSPAGLEGSTLHLAILRDLRRVNSHVSAIAYDVLGWADPLENQDESPSDAVEPTSTASQALTK
jgi:phosphate:Na+ symporter